MNIKLNSTKKSLAYCFLKEYARNKENMGNDELIEDEWVFNEMEALGLFSE